MFVNIKNKLGIYIFIINFSFFPQFATAYDITDAINAALNNNQALQAARHDFEAASIGENKAIAEFLPQVYASANYSQVSGAKSSSVRGKSLPTATMPYTGQVVVKQEIFSGLSSVHKTKAAKSNTRSEKANYEDITDILIKNTIAAYQNVLLMRQKNIIANDKRKLIQQTAEIARIKNKIGAVKASDVAEVEARLAKAEAETNNAAAELYNAEENFTHLAGQKPGANLTPIQRNSIAIPSNLNEIQDKVLHHNQLIISNKEKLAQLHSMQNVARSSFFPKVSAFATTSNTNTITGSRAGQPYHGGNTVGISITVPIFQQSIEYAEVRASKMKAQAQEFRLYDTIDDIMSRTASAWHSYQASLVSLVANKKTIKARELVVAAAKSEFEMGTKSITDLLEAQTDLLQSKIDMALQEAVCVAWLVEIKYLIGGMQNLSTKIIPNPKINNNNPNY